MKNLFLGEEVVFKIRNVIHGINDFTGSVSVS